MIGLNGVSVVNELNEGRRIVIGSEVREIGIGLNVIGIGFMIRIEIGIKKGIGLGWDEMEIVIGRRIGIGIGRKIRRGRRNYIGRKIGIISGNFIVNEIVKESIGKFFFFCVFVCC